MLRLLNASTSMTVEMTRWAMDFMFEIKKSKLGGVQ